MTGERTFNEGAKLIASGDQAFELDFERDIFLGGDLYRVRVSDPTVEGGVAIATVTL